jgi:CheY-like chemotaxis protein
MPRVLVVDDDPISTNLLTNTLTKFGYTVRAATDGWEACQIIEQEQFDAIVTDEIMSAMNGLEFCRFVRDRGIEIPIIMVTSLDERLNQPELRDEYGIAAVLGKPLSPPLLLFILEAQLELSAEHG